MVQEIRVRLKQRTLGLPVVPLEKLKKAIFVFASPGFSVLSTKFGPRLKPCEIKSRTFGCPTFGKGSNRTTRSAEMPTLFAADRAISSDSGCVKIKQAFVASS